MGGGTIYDTTLSPPKRFCIQMGNGVSHFNVLLTSVFQKLSFSPNALGYWCVRARVNVCVFVRVETSVFVVNICIF